MEEDTGISLVPKIDLKEEDAMMLGELSTLTDEKKVENDLVVEEIDGMLKEDISEVENKQTLDGSMVYVAVPITNDDLLIQNMYDEANEDKENIDIVDINEPKKKRTKRVTAKHPPCKELIDPMICDICEELYKNHVAFALHSIEHSPDKKYSCHLCNYRNASKYHIEMHVRVHEGTTRYKCEICLKAFTISTHAKEHKYFHTGEKPFQCEICGKKFMFSWFLTSHRRTQHWELVTGKPLVKYDCHICQKHYTSSTGLKRHNVSHHGAHGARNMALCEICGKILSNKEKLKFHIRIHTGYKPHACTYCAKCFSKKEQLKEHLRVHTGERPYVCKQCNKGFTQRSPLRIHERIHSGERPYICSVCDKGFISKSSMDIHKRRCEVAKALYEEQCRMEMNAHQWNLGTLLDQKEVSSDIQMHPKLTQMDSNTIQEHNDETNSQKSPEPELKDDKSETGLLEQTDSKKKQNLETISLELYARAMEQKLNNFKDLTGKFDFDIEELNLVQKSEYVETKKVESENFVEENNLQDDSKVKPDTIHENKELQEKTVSKTNQECKVEAPPIQTEPLNLQNCC